MKLSMKLGSLFEVGFVGFIGGSKGSNVGQLAVFPDASLEFGAPSINSSRKSFLLSSVVCAVGNVLGAGGQAKVKEPVVEGVSVNVVNRDTDRNVSFYHQPDGSMNPDCPVDSIDLEVGSHATGLEGVPLPPSGPPYFTGGFPRNYSSFGIVIKGLAKALSQGRIFGRLRIGSHLLSDLGFRAGRSDNFPGSILLKDELQCVKLFLKKVLALFGNWWQLRPEQGSGFFCHNRFSGSQFRADRGNALLGSTLL